MASPKPLPPAGAFGARKNLSKIRGSNSGDKLRPVVCDVQNQLAVFMACLKQNWRADRRMNHGVKEQVRQCLLHQREIQPRERNFFLNLDFDFAPGQLAF